MIWKFELGEQPWNLQRLNVQEEPKWRRENQINNKKYYFLYKAISNIYFYFLINHLQISFWEFESNIPTGKFLVNRCECINLESKKNNKLEMKKKKQKNKRIFKKNKNFVSEIHNKCKISNSC